MWSHGVGSPIGPIRGHSSPGPGQLAGHPVRVLVRSQAEPHVASTGRGDQLAVASAQHEMEPSPPLGSLVTDRLAVQPDGDPIDPRPQGQAGEAVPDGDGPDALTIPDHVVAAAPGVVPAEVVGARAGAVDDPRAPFHQDQADQQGQQGQGQEDDRLTGADVEHHDDHPGRQQQNEACRRSHAGHITSMVAGPAEGGESSRPGSLD